MEGQIPLSFFGKPNYDVFVDDKSLFFKKKFKLHFKKIFKNINSYICQKK